MRAGAPGRGVVQPAADRPRVLARLVDEQVSEARHPGPVAHGVGEQLGELGGVAPAARPLVEDQRDDGAQAPLARKLRAGAVPDAAAVLEQAESYPAIGPGLVLQEHVQPCRRCAGLAPDREEQVGLGVAQVRVDEAAILQGEGGPAQVAGEVLRQVGAEQGGGLRVVGERCERACRAGAARRGPSTEEASPPALALSSAGNLGGQASSAG